MILIDRKENDPFFNIAAEEYTLKNFDEDVFMLWINRPSVIIGKHQVAAAEADILYTYRNNIPVIRRISGGGTVYHDEGNLNYSLITTGTEGKLVDYEKYAGTVIRALKPFGIHAYLENKTSLYTGETKFSGNAEHVFRKRVLHHGTLLFDTDIVQLRKCIRPAHKGYIDSSVRSFDSKTINLRELLPEKFKIEDLRKAITDQVRKDFPGIRDHDFSTSDRKEISKLADEKYILDEWNFGYSPKYELSKTIHHEQELITLNMSTNKGLIDKVEFLSNGNPILSDLSKNLKGVLHHPKTVLQVMNKANFVVHDDLLDGMF